MAFDLEVFNRQVYGTQTEVAAQNIAAFNEQSAGGITLVSSGSNQGDMSMVASFKKISGLVRRRNVYAGKNPVTATRLTHLKDISVKVAAGTPPIEFEPAQYRWILRNPDEASVVIGTQLAVGMMEDMLNTAVLGAVAAIKNNPAVVHTAGAEMKFQDLVSGAGKFGDRKFAIRAWVIHSDSMTQLFLAAVNNLERLFEYGSVNVMRDPFGRLFVMTDSPALEAATGKYNAIGLVEQGIMVEQNDDFDANMQTDNGFENIQRSYQAEWSYNLGILGYSWNEANGGKSPNNAAIGTTASWMQHATSHKDTAGVLVVNG